MNVVLYSLMSFYVITLQFAVDFGLGISQHHV